MSSRVFLGLGSNLGNRQENIAAALRLLNASPYLDLEKLSSLYASPPWGYESENEFFNCVAVFLLDADLPAVWQEIQAIERRLGKQRRNGGEGGCQDRSIDIDVLWSDTRGNTFDIEVPHPRAHERAFVLIPWIEVAKMGFILSGQSLTQWLGEVAYADRAAVRRVIAAGELHTHFLS